jgi:hypothetical protein
MATALDWRDDMSKNYLGLLAATLLAAGCAGLVAIKPYQLPSVANQQAALTVEEVARAFIAAGVTVETYDPSLAVIYSSWNALPNNVWRQRFVGTIDKADSLNLRVELKYCELHQPCREFPGQAWEVCQRDLAAFAQRVGQNLGRTAQLMP